MIVKIKNGVLRQAISLLFDLPLKGKDSRHRTRLIRKMEDRLKEVAEQEKELIKEHANKDEDGNPKTLDNGTKWDIKDIDAFVKDKQDLAEEELVLDGGDNEEMLKTVKSILLHCDREFKGQEATLYDYLCEQFEEESEEE